MTDLSSATLPLNGFSAVLSGCKRSRASTGAGTLANRVVRLAIAALIAVGDGWGANAGRDSGAVVRLVISWFRRGYASERGGTLRFASRRSSQSHVRSH
jgi:hypothetical protein